MSCSRAATLSALVLSALALAACGSAASTPDTPPGDSTAGGEVSGVFDAGTLPEPAEPSEAESSEPESSEPVVLRNTIPVPVPQPAVRRERLSRPLQAVWTQVEEQVAVAAPRGPDVETLETVQTWAQGTFLEWIRVRRDLLERTRELLAAVPDDPPHERAMALALWAFAFEDFGAQIARAPVPPEVARDDELRSIYIRSLNDATVPIGTRAVELYADCQRRLVVLGDDSPWLPWRAYCVQRGQDVIRGYGLSAAPGSPDGD